MEPVVLFATEETTNHSPGTKKHIQWMAQKAASEEAMKTAEQRQRDGLPPEDEECESQTKTSKKQKRKKVVSLTCDDQPVLYVSLLGRILVFQNACYAHCRRCGALHQYSIENWKFGTYQCQECWENRDTRNQPVRCCAFCGDTKKIRDSRTVPIRTFSSDPMDESFSTATHAHSMERLYYFCDKHYWIARRLHGLLSKEQLWKRIEAKDKRSRIPVPKAMYYNHITRLQRQESTSAPIGAKMAKRVRNAKK